MVKRYGELCAAVRHALFSTEGENAAPVARELTAFAVGRTVEELLRDSDRYASDGAEEKVRAVLAEYLSGTPLAYILGEWSFFGIPLTVDRRVLIPRDDTMAVTELAMEKASACASGRVLDLCTGSGCIGIAVATRLPQCRVTLADVSEDALAVAKENVARCRLQSRVSVVRADALLPAPRCLRAYDVLTANPPYVTQEEMKTLPPSVASFEPHLALCGGADGLDFYRAICRGYRRTLLPGGWICLEFGMGQQDAVARILEQNGFDSLHFRRDNSNILRAVAARKTERNE